MSRKESVGLDGRVGFYVEEATGDCYVCTVQDAVLSMKVYCSKAAWRRMLMKSLVFEPCAQAGLKCSA